MKLNVNGSQHDIDVDPRTPLLYVLREDLELNAAKFGCGLGQCGACTVLVDGEPVFSCVTPVALLGRQGGHDAGGPRHGRSPGADPARLHRGAGGAMRLLHSGHHDAGACAVAEKSARRRGGHPRFPRAASVPLRHAYADPARHPSRPGGDAVGECGRQRMSAAIVISRRAVLAGSGALVFSFSSAGQAVGAKRCSRRTRPDAGRAALPGSLKQTPYLDSWIRIDANGAITVFTGKAELGQGIKTALMQIAAEQLDVDFGQHQAYHRRHGADPERGLHRRQPFDAGLRHGDHECRRAGAAAPHRRSRDARRRAGRQMKTQDAAVIAPDGRRFGYGELVSAQLLHVAARRDVAAEGPWPVQGHEPAHSARRHSRQSDRRRGLRAGLASGRHGPCPGRAAAAAMARSLPASTTPRCARCRAW